VSAAPDAAPRCFPPGSPLFAAPPAPPAAGRLKDDAETIIWPADLEDGRRAIVKMYRRRGAAAFLRERLSRFRVQREYAALAQLSASGVPCSEPLAWAYGRSVEHGRYELLATLEIPAARSVMELVRDGQERHLDLAPLFRSVRRMHEGGVFHGALKLHNVLGARGRGGELGYHVIDMPRALLFRGSLVGTPMADFDLLRLATDAARVLGEPAERLPLAEYGLDERARRDVLARMPGFRASKGARMRIHVRGQLAQLRELLGARGPRRPSTVRA